MIKVKFFAILRERLNCDELEVVDAPQNVAALREQLSAKDEFWHEMLDKFGRLVAVNQELVDEQQALKDGDEVAFFPPVTGG